MDGMKESIKSVTAPMKQHVKLLGIVFMVLVSAAAGFVGGWAGSKANQQGAFSAETSQQIISNESELISKIAKEVGPSVVSVNVTSHSAQSGFFGLGSAEQQSAGTGFVVSDEGLILTNRHVIADGGTVTVTLSDGTELTDVEIVGQTSQGDPLDVAFLKVKDKKGKSLVPVKLGDSSKMEVGDKVVAIGNALGQFQNTVTTGIISGYGRDLQASDGSGLGVESLQNLFQTDAAINQGNSGGPLVNLNGEVVGINTAVAGDGAENIGFAIPINDTKGLVGSVLEKGKLERPYLGVRYVSLTDDYAYEFKLKTKRGAYIVPSEGGRPSVLPNSPAEKAGLKEKDIIVKIDNEAIDEKNSLTSLMSGHKVDDKVTLTIVRDNKNQQVSVTLEAAPED
jgi:serine protease Do